MIRHGARRPKSPAGSVGLLDKQIFALNKKKLPLPINANINLDTCVTFTNINIKSIGVYDFYPHKLST